MTPRPYQKTTCRYCHDEVQWDGYRLGGALWKHVGIGNDNVGYSYTINCPPRGTLVATPMMEGDR